MEGILKVPLDEEKNLQAIDKDNDGELDLEEFMEAYARWKLLLFQELNVNC